MREDDEKKLGPADLGIDLDDGKPGSLYKWFLASLLFGKRIQQSIAAETYHVLIRHGLTSPDAFAKVSRERLMQLLTEGEYVHYRWKEDDELHDVMAAVVEDYGTVDNLVKSAASAQDLEQRLLAFKGVGPVTAKIFMEWIPSGLIGSA